MNSAQFNIRVYGLIINNKGEILLSDEYAIDTYMIKFPGGGLEYGEGPEDCIKREAIEEFGQEIKIINHFYTTHYFQPALFFKNTQLISIYYLIDFIKPIKFKISKKKFDFIKDLEGGQSFRWAAINSISADNLTFPIDKHVLKLLKEKYK